MRDSFKVARWEVKRTLTSKTFLIMTFLVPLIILIIGGVVGYFSAHDSAPDSLTVGVIDKTRLLSKEISREFNNISYTAVFFEDALVNYEQVIKEHDLDGILLIPEDVIAVNRVYYYFTDLDGLENETMENILDSIIIDKRLKARGYQPEEIYQLTKSVELAARPLGREGKAGFASMFLPLGLAMLMVFASMFSGGTLMQSIITEKSNRIVELILSSINSRSLMTGKVIGYGIMGLIQITIWSTAAIVVGKYFFSFSIFPLLNTKTLYMIIYFILGFILTASINAIVGAGMKEAQSGSQSTGILVIIPIIPVYFTSIIINNPNGTVSKLLSYIPFTTPTTMLIRLGFTSPSMLEIALTIVLLLVANYLLVRLAAKIFRVGMLMYGKNASFKELFKWARSKNY